MPPILSLFLRLSFLVEVVRSGKPTDPDKTFGTDGKAARVALRLKQAQYELPVSIRKRSEEKLKANERPTLRFREDGTFKIVQFADAHITTGNTSACKGLDLRQKQYPCSDANTTALLDAMLTAEDPDLVVFTGDNIFGPDLGGVGVETALELAFAPVIERGFPWAAVFGNHDSENNLNRSALMTWITAQPYSLAVPGPDFGPLCVGNYVLDVLPSASSSPRKNFRKSDERGSSVDSDNVTVGALTIYMLDSRAYSDTPGVDGYDWIHQNQIQWYLSEASARTDGSGPPPPAIAFWHIPLPEYAEAFGTGLATGTSVGRWQETVSSGAVNSGMAAALLEGGDVRVVSVGHDHNNEFCAPWMDSVAFCYGGGGGYHGYGQPRWDRRSRVFLATEGEGPDGSTTITTLKRVDNEDGLLTIDEQSLWPYSPSPPPSAGESREEKYEA